MFDHGEKRLHHVLARSVWYVSYRSQVICWLWNEHRDHMDPDVLLSSHLHRQIALRVSPRSLLKSCKLFHRFWNHMTDTKSIYLAFRQKCFIRGREKLNPMVRIWIPQDLAGLVSAINWLIGPRKSLALNQQPNNDRADFACKTSGIQRCARKDCWQCIDTRMIPTNCPESTWKANVRAVGASWTGSSGSCQ